MGAMVSQMTGLPIVYLTVYSGKDQRKHQSSVSLAFVGNYIYIETLVINAFSLVGTCTCLLQTITRLMDQEQSLIDTDGVLLPRDNTKYPIKFESK